MTEKTTKTQMSDEELNELIEAKRELQKIKKRQKDNWRRRNARLMIFKQKAENKGIVVTEEEIDEYLK